MYDLKTKDLLEFAYEIMTKIQEYGKPIFVCVGSDKYVCDSLGPMVAEILKKEYSIDSYVYGGLDYNIDANNLSSVINYIETVHGNDFIILIDATLGENIGKVVVGSGGYAGLGRCLPIKKFGAMSILGVVGRKGKDFQLNTTRMKVISQMADFIALGCYLAVSRYKTSKNDEKRNYMNNVI